MKRALVTILLLAATGCKLGPDFKKPVIDSPAEYREPAATQESLANLPWWEVFEDPALRQLIEIALAENKDLMAAAWRVESARALLGFTRADLYPSFGYDARAGRDDPSNAVPPLPGNPIELYSISAGVSWEIDLWGKLRRRTEAARAQLLVSEYGRRALTISLIADVARFYFLLRDFDERLAISERTLEGRRASTDLIRERFEGGIVSELDVRQAEIQEAIAAAAVPSFERQVAQVENALSVLLGRSPGPIVRGLELDRQVMPVDPPTGLPSELLRRRPDILQAEEQVHTEMARIGVARALRFPSLRLTGLFGIESTELSDLIGADALFGSIGASLVGPIFEFGKNQRRVEIARARTQQAVYGYEATVLDSLREVNDALIAIRTWREENQARVFQVNAARTAKMLSHARYDGGVTSYLEVLEAERSLFDSELEVSRTLQEQYSAIVDLFAALGGGWDPTQPVGVPEPVPATSVEVYGKSD